jgi:hypothetical protein
MRLFAATGCMSCIAEVMLISELGSTVLDRAVMCCMLENGVAIWHSLLRTLN